MSLSEIERPADELATRDDIAALHEEVHAVLGLVRKHDEMLEGFRPLIDRYAAVAASPSARWVRGRRPAEAAAHAGLCQGVIHMDPIAGCTRTGMHNWHASVGCHTAPAECNG